MTSAFTLYDRRGTWDTERTVVASSRGRHGISHGRRDTWWHPSSLCVAHMALCDVYLHFLWQAWLARALGAAVPVGAAAFRVAGMSFADINLRFVCRGTGWNLRHWAGYGAAAGSRRYILLSYKIRTQYFVII